MHFGLLEEINNPNIPPSELYGRTKAANIIGCEEVQPLQSHPTVR